LYPSQRKIEAVAKLQKYSWQQPFFVSKIVIARRAKPTEDRSFRVLVDLIVLN